MFSSTVSYEAQQVFMEQLWCILLCSLTFSIHLCNYGKDLPKNFKGGIRSFLTLVLTIGWRSYWPSCRGELFSLWILHDHLVQTAYIHYCYRLIYCWQRIGCPPHVPSRWPPELIPPFNFLGDFHSFSMVWAYTAHENYACFVPYLKIVILFWKLIWLSWSKVSEKLKNDKTNLEGPARWFSLWSKYEEKKIYCFDQHL